MKIIHVTLLMGALGCATPGNESHQASAPAKCTACWSSVTNPTPVQRSRAEAREREAADLRAQSVALRDAEARACVGVPLSDRAMSPFEHLDDVESVEPINEQVGGQIFEGAPGDAQKPAQQLMGAVVRFRAVPGLTAAWLQLVLNCHVARNQSLGHPSADPVNAPLVPEGAVAKVSTSGDGFAVAIRSEDPAIARDVLARAQRLLADRQASSSSR